MPDIRKANFLQDEGSQILALSDALYSAHNPTISAAFDEVARTRGLTQIARDSHISIRELCDAFANPACINLIVLQKMLAALTLLTTNVDIITGGSKD